MGSKAIEYHDRFYSKVQKTDGCWLWIGARAAGGYGAFAVARRLIKAHRFAYLLERGPIVGAETRVLHRCDNRRCVNPEHLFLGTQSDNMRDMYAKGRGDREHARGEQHASARLKTADVLAIRSSSEPRKMLAARYGISIPTIAAVRARRIWAHV